jgi:hypothetical protein
VTGKVWIPWIDTGQHLFRGSICMRDISTGSRESHLLDAVDGAVQRLGSFDQIVVLTLRDKMRT